MDPPQSPIPSPLRMNKRMSSNQPIAKQKLTLTQFRRYLPLLPPSKKPVFPEQLAMYLSSPKFSGLSLNQQKFMLQKYSSVYRNYFSIEDVKSHINECTNQKFTDISIQMAIKNASMKYGNIDWYNLIRKTYQKGKARRQLPLRDKHQSVNYIADNYRKYKAKKRIFNGIKEVDQVIKGLQQKLIRQFGGQAYGQLKQHCQKNRALTQSIFNQKHPQKINVIQLQEIINKKLGTMMQRKKVMYLYLKFDPKNRGKFLFKDLVDAVYFVPKQKVAKKEKEYLRTAQQVLQNIRQLMKSKFFSSYDMECNFDQIIQKANVQMNEQKQLTYEQFKVFVDEKSGKRYSQYQLRSVFKIIGFRDNLHAIYNSPKLKDLMALTLKMFTQKKRKALKQQNPIFYQFKQIIMRLISECKQDKLKRQQFNRFIVDKNSSVRYNSFYAVWRVYGSIINVKRMKQQLKLSPLSCYFRVRKNQEGYQNIIQDLLKQYPQDTEIQYVTFQEKINLHFDFILDNLGIPAIAGKGKFDMINYSQEIKNMFPQKIDEIIRKYIFNKVASKTYGLWKAHKSWKRKQLQKLVKQKLFQITLPTKQIKQSYKSSAKTTKRMKSDRSSASIRAKLQQQLLKVNPETLEIVRDNLYRIFNQLPIIQKPKVKVIGEQSLEKHHLALIHQSKYSYRAQIPKICQHPMAGVIGKGQQLMFMHSNRTSKLQLRIPYRPGLQIIDFDVIEQKLILLTSYLSIQIYGFGQSFNYPKQSFQVCSNYFADNFKLDCICKGRLNGVLPELLKTYGSDTFMVNTVFANNKLSIFNSESLATEKQVSFNQKQHYFPHQFIRLTDFLKKISLGYRSSLVANLTKNLLNKNENNIQNTYAAFRNLIYEINEKPNQQVDADDLKFTEFDYLAIKELSNKMSPYKFSCIIKQESDIYLQSRNLSIPQSLKSVCSALSDNMIEYNKSLWDMFEEIDKSHKGVLFLKNIKDYMLKMTQQIYQMHQAQIDAYLKHISVEKQVPYDAMVEVMQEWKLRIWQRPQSVVHQYFYMKDLQVVIYTFQNSDQIFIKNCKDSLLIGILEGHKCTPVIKLIEDRCLLISGDTVQNKPSSIKIWKLYDDLIGKYSENPPWKAKPILSIENCHDNAITSINYLSRAHTIVTTSFDSTMKIWQVKNEQVPIKKIEQQGRQQKQEKQRKDQNFKQEKSKQQPQKFEKQLRLSQIKRLYSNNQYVLNTSTLLIQDEKNHSLQYIAVCKVSKQINDNNKYKLQVTVDVYHLQNMRLEVSQEQKYKEIPLKLQKMLNRYCENLSSKKTQALAQITLKRQNQINKMTLVRSNIQDHLYHSIKRYYIFNDTLPIKNVIKFLQNLNHGDRILQDILQDKGLRIADPIQSLADALQFTFQQKMDNLQAGCNQIHQAISFPNDVRKQIFKILAKKTLIDHIEVSHVYQTLTKYILGQNQTFKAKIQQLAQMRSGKKQIKFEYLQKLIAGYTQSSQITRLYYYLRLLKKKLSEKGMKMWRIFAAQKYQLQKKRWVSIQNFENALKALNFTAQRIQLIVSFLQSKGCIFLEDLLYYQRLAWQQVNVDMRHSNFSDVLMKNSRLLESRFLANQSKLKPFQNESTVNKHLTESAEKLRQSSPVRSQHSMPKNESNKKLESASSNQKMQESGKSRQKSRDKSKQKDRQQAFRSRFVTSTNSKVSFSRDISHTKDSFKRQVHQITLKLKQVLKNESKTFWEVISLTVADFMETNVISETEYFNIYTAITSPFKLKDKIQLMNFIKQQTEGRIDLSILFELTEVIEKNKFHGEKYVVSFMVRIITECNLTIQQALQNYFFDSREEVNIQDLITGFSKQPFSLQSFALKQLELILLNQNKATFTPQQIVSLIEKIAQEHNIRIQTKKMTFIEDLIFKIERRGFKMEEMFPKSEQYTYSKFYDDVKKINPDAGREQLKSDFILIASRTKVKKQVSNKNIDTFTIKHSDFIKNIWQIIQNTRKSLDDVKTAAKRMVKNLELKRISLFSFFAALDRTKKFYLNEAQFEIGTQELNIKQDLWKSIKKKNARRLYYFELITFLLEKQAVNYKSVDSQLQMAMDKFIRRFIRSQDTEVVFDRMKARTIQYPNEVTYQSFKNAVKMGNLFKQQQIYYCFCALVNAQTIRKSKFSNDSIIKDPANSSKVFNLKMFMDVINHFKTEKLATTPAYKFCDFIKKRNISLINEFNKFLDRNKRIKQISQAIRTKTMVLPKEIFIQFINELRTGLTQAEAKQITNSLPNPVQFQNFNSRIQQIYKKGNANIENQEVKIHLQEILKLTKKQDVTIERIFQDFASEKGKMYLKDLNQMCTFLCTGLNKINIKQIYNSIDLQKKGFISYMEFYDAIQEAGEDGQKEDQQFELQYVVQKLSVSKDKYSLKVSKINFSQQRAAIIFDKVLSDSQTGIVYKAAQTYYKNEQLTEKKIQSFIHSKFSQIQTKKDKKYKQLIVNLLKYLKKTNIEVNQIYNYFSKDTNSLPKSKFLILYQSLQTKANFLEINALYSHLDENKSGSVSVNRWEEKLNIVKYEQQSGGSQQWTGEELQIFYKAKMFLTELYLIFIRKYFKRNQIFSYFDKNGQGNIKYEQFWLSVADLGIHFDPDLQRKVNNYLDKNRTKSININSLVNELQQAGGKAKTILQTKTSCIFKARQSIFIEKSNYLIQRIIEAQSFIQDNHICVSSILQHDFLLIIADFGVVLQQDQIKDVHTNFSLNERYLKLYPIYFMFVNNFKDVKPTDAKQSQKRRFQRLFQTMIKRNIVIKQIEKLNTSHQLSLFLEQLKIFTPIEVRLILETVVIPQTTAVNIKSLKDNILHSYLSSQRLSLGMQTMSQMKNYFRGLFDKRELIRAIGSTKGKINLGQFLDVLIKINGKMTKGQAKHYFDIFSKDKQTLQIEDLLKQEEQAQQNRIFVKDEDQQGEVQMSHPDLLVDHICKSIDFKQISLRQALAKYFSANFGQVEWQKFDVFLKQIGFDSKQNKRLLQNFLNAYRKYCSSLKFSQLEKMMLDRGYQPKKRSILQKYHIESKGINFLSNYFINNESFEDLLQKWMIKNHVQMMTKEKCFMFLSSLNFPKQYKNTIRLLCHLLPKGQFSVQQIWEQFQRLLHFQQANIDLKNTTLQLLKMNKKIDALIIQKQNFVKLYDIKVKEFVKATKVNIHHSGNLSRLSYLLVLEQFLKKPHLLRIQPYFTRKYTKQNSQNKRQANRAFDISNKYTLQQTNIIVQLQQDLDKNGLRLINEKFIGVLSKDTFQPTAVVSTIINPNAKFYKIKAYYCWMPNDNPLPKMAINYRWKYIPIIVKRLLNVLLKIQNSGFCCPHLRWDQLHSQHVVDKILHPCQLDSTGKIKKFLFQKSISKEDPYCAPQILGLIAKRQDSIPVYNVKIDSWIFGCLLYQFIFGHPPSSFNKQIQKHMKMRNTSLQQVGTMSQLPYQFNYKFWDEQKIRKLFSEQHMMKISLCNQDSERQIKYSKALSGILRTSQVMHGNQLPMFKGQFATLASLLEIIDQCLQFNPQSRPSIQQLITRSVFNQQIPVFNYLQILKVHPNSNQLLNNFIQPITDLFKNNSIKQTDTIAAYCEKLCIWIDRTFEVYTISEQFILPKYYPHFFDKQGQYGQNIVKNKTKLLQCNNYPIINLFFRSNILDMLIYFQITTQSSVLLELLVKIFMRFISYLRSYGSPVVLYVKEILQGLAKLIYGVPSSMFPQSESWFEQYASQKHNIRMMVRKMFYRVSKLTGSSLKALSLLKTMVRQNGQGNPEYLPVHNYLQQKQSIASFFQAFYMCVGILQQERQTIIVSINYFRDQILQGINNQAMLALRVEVLMLRILTTSSQEIQQMALLFFQELTASTYIFKSPLFEGNVFYMHLAMILRQTSQSIMKKGLAIRIIKNSMTSENAQLMDKLKLNSANLVREILRLMVQPARDSVEHSQFMELFEELRPIAEIWKQILVQDPEYFEGIQGMEFIIQSYLNLNY